MLRVARVKMEQRSKTEIKLITEVFLMPLRQDAIDPSARYTTGKRGSHRIGILRLHHPPSQANIHFIKLGDPASLPQLDTPAIQP